MSFEHLVRPTGLLNITLATQNEGKRRELTRWIAQSGASIRFVLNPNAPDVSETGSSFLENARLKARQTPPVEPGGWVLAEDSGLVVDALAGTDGLAAFPGIYSNRWLTPARRDALLGGLAPNRMPMDRTTADGITNSDLCLSILALMDGQSNRNARYCCGMVLYRARDGLTLEALGTTELCLITGDPRGTEGFGYDPITVPEGETRTMAELTPDEKNRISHRGRALEAILTQLAQTLRTEKQPDSTTETP